MRESLKVVDVDWGRAARRQVLRPYIRRRQNTTTRDTGVPSPCEEVNVCVLQDCYIVEMKATGPHQCNKPSSHMISCPVADAHHREVYVR